MVGGEAGVGVRGSGGDALRRGGALAPVLVEGGRGRVRPGRVGAVDLAVPFALGAAAARPARAGRGPVRYSSREDLLVGRVAGVRGGEVGEVGVLPEGDRTPIIPDQPLLVAVEVLAPPLDRRRDSPLTQPPPPPPSPP